MAWAELILYITKVDAERIRDWINDEEQVAWIIATVQSGSTYSWKVVDRLDAIREQEYAIWHRESGPLTIPSGQVRVPDITVLDPYGGWDQVLESTTATAPWFGANLPGPYSFTFREGGSPVPRALRRSGFSWAGDHYRSIGSPAKPEAKRWWQRLKRFIRSQATSVPWPYPDGVGRHRAYAFDDAYRQMLDGRPVDANP